MEATVGDILNEDKHQLSSGQVKTEHFLHPHQQLKKNNL